jgi:hypothetical protein
MKQQNPAPFNGCIDYGMWFLLCLVFSPAMLYLGTKTIADDQDLQTSGRIVNASITAMNQSSNKTTEKYEVKYHFSPNGGKNWYSCADQTGRQNLWCGVTKVQYQQSQKNHWIEVVYVPGNPWINRPRQSQPPSRMIDSIAGIFLGITPWILLAFISFNHITSTERER